MNASANKRMAANDLALALIPLAPRLLSRASLASCPAPATFAPATFTPATFAPATLSPRAPRLSWYTEGISYDISAADTEDMLRDALHHNRVTPCQFNLLRMMS